MAQHDMDIANQGFPAFRADLNNALAALVSNSSGSTEPSATFAHQFWVDTSADPSVLKQRNADDDAWITIGTLNQTSDVFNLAVAQGGTGAADAAGARTNLGALAAENPEYTGTLTGGTGVVNLGSGQLYKDAAGNVGIGTSSQGQPLTVVHSASLATSYALRIQNNSTTAGSRSGLQMQVSNGTGGGWLYVDSAVSGDAPYNVHLGSSQGSSSLIFESGGSTERARIDSSGNLLVGKTSTSLATVGLYNSGTGVIEATATSSHLMQLNRLSTDGNLINFFQASTQEGSISVSGTTVSYNGGHLSRWAQTTTAKDESLVKGTVLSNLDEMNVYTDAEGNPVENEQLNKVKVSDVEGDANVAGVFVNWEHDEAHNVDEINMAMTGDMIIRIAQGVTVQRGDLLMSAGDGTAKPQGDDIVRSKTIAKVTSTHVTCTYADGSFCVPCVLMAC
jgi:hypothetical protein